MTVVGCLGCDLIAGRRPLPGGILHRTASWVVSHVVGPLNVGTLVLSPLAHVTAIADLPDAATAEFGPLLRRTTRVVEELGTPEQPYVCLWAHGPGHRRHLHFVVQPVTADLVAAHGGLRSERLQAAMLAAGVEPDPTEVERFCAAARARFADEDLPARGLAAPGEALRERGA
ncbi:HIT family protein [Asanoa siamensis]|uniref:Diadenosine tetraphosphate (Ap4A) HIT family hydrolase n=1 Tax=Asanoa siamensis TaxID=926357 RepID=A0ABQ4CV19_9ACTN|nr:hypothetical protein [Asanoa siamensis]GIF75134.1 hypothetical protein Asi02nite_46520 [Asanoa siamensis]